MLKPSEQTPIIIAECCQNHNGDRKILQEMIHAAKVAGAHFVKIQSIQSKELTHRVRFDSGRISSEGKTEVIKRPFAPEFERLSKLDLKWEDQVWFVEECRRYNIEPMTTVFTRTEIPKIASLGWTNVKVASYDCASPPLLKALKENFEFLYVSTGATFDNEIAEAASCLAGTSFAFLHCVTLYPTPLNQLNLKRMEWLRQFTPHIGFSDHSKVSRDGLKACYAALALGAQVVERHFTVQKEDQTRDGPVSINPSQLKELVDFSVLPLKERMDFVQSQVPEFKEMLGQETKALSDEELLNRDYYRGRFATQENGKVLWNWKDQWEELV